MTLTGPELLYSNNRIPLDIMSNTHVFSAVSTPRITDFGATENKQVAELSTPLAPFGRQMPAFIATVKKASYGFWVAAGNGEFKVNQQDYADYFKSHVVSSKAAYAVIISDATNPAADKPVCHVAFEKTETAKADAVRLLPASDSRAKAFAAQSARAGPPCALTQLNPQQVQAYQKAAQAVREGKPLSFIPGNCPTAAVLANCRPDRFYTYEIKPDASGTLSVMATDVQTGAPFWSILAPVAVAGTPASTGKKEA